MSLLFLALCCGSFQDRPSPKAPEATVVVQGKALRLPSLPADFAEARRRNREIQAELLAEAESIRELLRELSDRTPGLPPGKTAVPKEDEAQARILMAHLQNPKNLEAESVLLSALKAWEEARKNPHSPTPGPENAKGVKIDQPPAASPRIHPNPFNPKLSAVHGLPGLAANEAHGEALQLDAFEAGQAFRYEASRAQTRSALASAARHVPLVRQAWDGLVASLEERGRLIGEWETQASASTAPVLVELQRRIKVQFLQRYQASLELCSAIWAGFAL